jgi:hypothetical protein
MPWQQLGMDSFQTLALCRALEEKLEQPVSQHLLHTARSIDDLVTRLSYAPNAPHSAKTHGTEASIASELARLTELLNG